MNKQKKNAGFSLMEVMIVIAIIGIVAAIGTPAFLEYRDDAKIRGAVGNLRGDFGLAKQRAIKENAFVVIQFAADGYTMFVDNGAGVNEGNWVLDGDETRLTTRTLPAGVTISLGETTFAGNRTRFDGRALPEVSGSDDTVVIQDFRGVKIQITINKVGRINIT